MGHPGHLPHLFLSDLSTPRRNENQIPPKAPSRSAFSLSLCLLGYDVGCVESVNSVESWNFYLSLEMSRLSDSLGQSVQESKAKSQRKAAANQIGTQQPFS